MQQQVVYKKNERYGKGVVIAHSRRILRVRGEPNKWMVESDTKDGVFYKASFAGCECPDNQYRGLICKHIIALMQWISATA